MTPTKLSITIGASSHASLHPPLPEHSRTRLRRALFPVALSLLAALPGAAFAQSLDHALELIESPRTIDGRGAGYGEDAEAHAALHLAELMEATGTPAISVAIWSGETIAARAWGTAEMATGDPATTDTLFQAASISKPVFAMAVLRLVELGYLTLDGPINSWLSSWEVPEGAQTDDEAVTARRLLSHSAGTTIHGFPGYSPTATLPTVPQVLSGAEPANTGPVLVDTLPGTLERYSGGGTTLMQLAVADLTGQATSDVLDELVLEPAGATSSGYLQPLPERWHARAARAHISRERRDDPWHVYPELAAAGLWTTPSDLARIAIDVQKSIAGDLDRILAPRTARLATLPVGPGSFGIGWNTQDRAAASAPQDAPLWYFSHSGGNWGFRSNLLAKRNGGYGYVAMINGGDFAIIIEIQKRLAQALRWEGDFMRAPRNWPQ